MHKLRESRLPASNESQRIRSVRLSVKINPQRDQVRSFLLVLLCLPKEVIRMLLNILSLPQRHNWIMNEVEKPNQSVVDSIIP